MIKNWLRMWRVFLLTPYYMVLFLSIPILWILGLLTIGYTWKWISWITKTLNEVDKIIFSVGRNHDESN